MRFKDILRYLKSTPLRPSKTCTVRLSNHHDVTWTEFGQTNSSKVKHVILYFHGSPMCRYEPMLHSILPDPLSQQLEKSNQDSLPGNDVNKQHNIRLCCYERPGFGITPYISNRRLIDFVEDVAEVLDMEEMKLPTTSSSLFSQNKAKVSVIGYSAGGPYDLAFRQLFPSKVYSTAVIASSVSAAMDKVYSNSWRGQMERFFFSLSISFQSVFYNLSIDTESEAMNHQSQQHQLQTNCGYPPPLFLYYSKDDTTVPWEAGVRLAEYLKSSKHNYSLKKRQ